MLIAARQYISQMLISGAGWEANSDHDHLVAFPLDSRKPRRSCLHLPSTLFKEPSLETHREGVSELYTTSTSPLQENPSVFANLCDLPIDQT